MKKKITEDPGRQGTPITLLQGFELQESFSWPGCISWSPSPCIGLRYKTGTWQETWAGVLAATALVCLTLKLGLHTGQVKLTDSAAGPCRVWEDGLRLERACGRWDEAEQKPTVLCADSLHCKLLGSLCIGNDPWLGPCSCVGGRQQRFS